MAAEPCSWVDERRSIIYSRLADIVVCNSPNFGAILVATRELSCAATKLTSGFAMYEREYEVGDNYCVFHDRCDASYDRIK